MRTMKSRMPLDDLALRLQSWLDRLVRRLRLGRPPAAGPRRLLVVQIDGLSRSVLERALARGQMPFLRRLLARPGVHLSPMSVGLPTSTPAFQMAAMYGVRPDIPGFHFHDKRRGTDVYFPRTGDAAGIEERQAVGRRGIVTGGSTYGCVFTGGATNNLLTFTMLKRPSGAGLVRALSAAIVLGWVIVKSLVISILAITRAILGLVADPVSAPQGWKLLMLKIGVSVWIRELFTLSASRDLYGGAPAVYVNYLDYDIFAHAWGPRSPRAMRALRAVDASIHHLYRVLRRAPRAPLRSLHSVRPRPGALHALRAHHRRPPSRAPSVRRSSWRRPALTRWRPGDRTGATSPPGSRRSAAAASPVSCSGSSTTSSTTSRGVWARSRRRTSTTACG